MGLDQVAYARSMNEPTQVLMEWRKHPDLHGWMEALFKSKGGKGEFNCQPVELTLEDLVALEQAVRNNQLPHTDGFFFGSSGGEDKIDDLEFIKRARRALKQNKRVYYDSWW